MKASQYAKVAGHPLRTIFRNMVTDARDIPTISELRAAIDEAVPSADAKTKEALFDSARALAKAAADQGRESWFDLPGEADRRVLALVEGWESADRLLGDDEDTEPVDVSAVMESIDNYDPTQRALRAMDDQMKAGQIEAARRLNGGG